MAKQKPSDFIEKLRLEAGADEVFPNSSFTQTELATSYKLGNSTLAVSGTPADWPNTGKGMVNTSRASDIFATQTFQATGDSDIYTRRWDDSPIDFSDEFGGVNGDPLDSLRWTLKSGLTVSEVDILNGKARVRSSGGGFYSNFTFLGDFEVHIDITISGDMRPEVKLVTPADAPNFNAGNPADSFGFSNLSTSQGWGSYMGTSYSDEEPATIPTGSQSFRIVRVGNGISMEFRPYGSSDAWTVFRTGTQNAELQGSGKFRFKSSISTTTYFDSFRIISGVVQHDVPQDASWSDWSKIKNADDTLLEAQTEASNAVSGHETTYDHTSFSEKLSVDTTVAVSAYTVSGTDLGTRLIFTNAGSATITLPSSATEDIVDGFKCTLRLENATGVVIVAVEGADVLHSPNGANQITTQYSEAVIIKKENGVWELNGDIV